MGRLIHGVRNGADITAKGTANGTSGKRWRGSGGPSILLVGFLADSREQGQSKPTPHEPENEHHRDYGRSRHTPILRGRAAGRKEPEGWRAKGTLAATIAEALVMDRFPP